MRISSLDQRPEIQLLDLCQMASQRGYEIVQEYTDRISGAKAKRPGLDQMMVDARRGKFDVVLVWASDRIARSVKHFLEVLDELNRLNIEYVSFREQIDTGGELVVTARIAIKTRICSHDIGLIKFHLLKQLESAPSTIFFASSADVIGRPAALCVFLMLSTTPRSSERACSPDLGAVSPRPESRCG